MSAKQTWIAVGVGAVALLCCGGIVTSGAVFLLRDASGEAPEAQPATPGVNVEVDPCIVGRWRLVASKMTVADDQRSLELTMTRGGALMVLDGDGTGSYDLSDHPTYTTTAFGHDIKIVRGGRATTEFTAQDGVLREEIDVRGVTEDLYVDGELEPPASAEPQSNVSSYTCDDTSLVVTMETLHNEYARE